MAKQKVFMVFLAAVTTIWIGLTNNVFAASSDTVNITVTISQTIGVDITETSYNFGTLATSVTSTSASSLTVTNTGSGANETYSLNCSNTANWTAGSSPATNVFVLSAKFNSIAPTSFVAGDILSTTPVASDGTHFAGNETGSSVPYQAVRHLWLQLKTPTSTSASAQQTIVLTITGSIS
ncbi:hypothetical protein HZA56_10845 [Candidatus Poribacteria bacterium]|nr:hypothetical protein [Candidatus Poribacteria bacterium]